MIVCKSWKESIGGRRVELSGADVEEPIEVGGEDGMAWKRSSIMY